MDPRFQTSFIPKKSLAAGGRTRPRAVSIGSYVATAVFIAVLALSVGVFLYQQFLKQRIVAMTASLERARAAFDPALLAELQHVDTKIETAKTLLGSHLAPSPVFSLLQATTLRGIRFDSFVYEVTGMDHAAVSLKGEAQNFSAVALQADAFNENPDMRAPVFSNLQPDARGLVTFSFSGVINPRLVRYEPSLP